MSTAAQSSAIAELIRGEKVHFNLTPIELVEYAIRRGEGKLADTGALVCLTGARTGRSPKDRFIVKDAEAAHVDWNDSNQPCTAELFDSVYQKALSYLQGRELFVQELFAGADSTYRLKVRFVNENAWHNMFVWNQFVRPTASEREGFEPEFTVISAPGLLLDPKTDGTRSEVFIGVSFSRRIILVVGTGYAGEMKKSIFSALNYLLPERNVFPMHCSANVGEKGDTALFFGLSGTGKTTLSADPDRRLIGDDEHGWSDKGIFNFEGGCYAKCIKLSQKNEPQIWNSLRFGAVLENVVIDEARHADYDDDKLTENTRANYPVEFIDGAVIPSVGGHPKVVVFLTADAFGVLPPVSKLSPEQAMFHFLSGYTAKVAGTEAGVDGATGDVLDLLWRTLHAASAAGLRRTAAQAHGGTRRRGLAGEHRLAGRQVWSRQAHGDSLHPRHGDRRGGWHAEERRVRARPRLRPGDSQARARSAG